MKKLGSYTLLALLFTASALPAQSNRSSKPGKPGKPAADKPKPAAPKTYENAEHKFRFEAPDTWQSAPGGCAGSICNLLIAPDLSSLAKGKPGQSRTIYGDMFTVAVNPLPSADMDLAAAVSDIQAQVTKAYPAAEFKPLEKAKVAGVDASVLTATMPGRHDDEPKIVQRLLIFLRDGKVFQINLYAHANTIARQTTAVQKIVKSFEWTDQPAAAAAAAAAPGQKGPPGMTGTGAFTSAEHGLRLQLPAGWDAGDSSLPGSIASFFPPGDASGHVNLFTRDPQGKDADGVLSVLQGEIRSHDANAKFDPIEDAKLGGEPARLLTYRVKLGDEEKSSLMLAGLHAGKAYVIMYGAPPAEYEKSVAAVKRMIESFRWTKTGGGSGGATTKPAA